MAELIVEACEVWENGSWQPLRVEDALNRRADIMRCPQCHGPVRPHKLGTTGQRAHFEHRGRHTGCSLMQRTFSGTHSLHPDALD
ncbi:hypothetical protein J2X65_001811 [Ancylobacter sp. 3268]|uniref:hypothetical protein n=1 Tax=Ancylobacter sp. 3268 TaxID=2817752 RepID=UPI00285CCF84|nr:hypothetical protein [Ancylobacter sp. 3268]MDR6952456.1 hypothetical protein [Ancylobacter sp. 3268]